jgi:hypothetical protein
MKPYSALLLFLLESASLLNASPVSQEHQHSTSLVEGEGKGTHVHGRLNEAGQYSIASNDLPAPQITAPRRVRVPRRERIDTTLTPWTPPVRNKGEPAKAFRNRYLKAESADRIQREAKKVVLEHFPDEEQASKIYLEYAKDERDRIMETFEKNQALRKAGLLPTLTPEERRQKERKRWVDANRKFRVVTKLRETSDSAEKRRLLAKAKELGIDTSNVYEKPSKGRVSHVKDRVHAFLLRNGHVTEESLKAAKGKFAPTSTATTTKMDFLDNVTRKPRSRIAPVVMPRYPLDHNRPSTPPGSEGYRHQDNSPSSISGGSAFPRQKRTKTFVVDEPTNQAQTHVSLASGQEAFPLPKGDQRRTRTSVVKRKKVEAKWHELFGDL